MPRAAIAMDAACEVLPLRDVGDALLAAVSSTRRTPHVGTPVHG
jgi:chemotaxis response regulator CheB